MMENETKEFKKTTGEINEGIVSIVAILNKHKKGELFFGVKNDGSPFKFEITDSTLRDVSRKIYEAIRPQIFPVIETISLNGVDVIRVEFSGEDIPYSAFGRYYIRVADEDRELSPQELRKIMISKEYEENWCDKITAYTAEDIDDNSLLNFYHSASECGRFPKIGYEKETILIKNNLMRNGHLTNAAVMLFSKWKPITLKLVVFATSARVTILEMKTVKGNIFELIDEAMNFVMENIRWRVVIDEKSTQRKEIPEIPLVALREVIMNSFAHARYDGNVQHEIDVYSNRISIINPGSFANDFTPYDFYKRDLKSYLRNQSIADALYLCKDVETCGHGLKKVYQLCNDSKVDISYINNENDFTIEFSRADRNEVGEINGEINGELSQQEQAVLSVFRKNKNAIKKDIITETGYSSRSIDRVIRLLKNKELIKRIGANKNGYWEVLH